MSEFKCINALENSLFEWGTDEFGFQKLKMLKDEQELLISPLSLVKTNSCNSVVLITQKAFSNRKIWLICVFNSFINPEKW